MENAKYILEFILQYGLLGFLLVVLLLIIHNPDRAEKLRALILEPSFRLFKWGSRQYLASEVGYTTTEFFKRHVTRLIPSLPDVKIKIKWVTSPSDPVLSEDGKVVLRLEETNDQTRNILAATRVALPHVVCPTLRPNLEQYAQTAIDLALLRKLADRLGKHARPIFQRYFLMPEVEENHTAATLFAKLVELDAKGTFVSIFLEELNVLGETLYASADVGDKTDEINSFLEYLLTEARREVSKEIFLEYLSTDFRVGIVLVAKTSKAKTRGIEPYLQAIDVNIKRGCDSIYIIAYSGFFTFLKHIINVVEGDERLSVMQVNKVRIKSSNLAQESDVRKIVLLLRNTVFSDSTFKERLDASGIKEGDLVEGTVMDVSQNVAVVDIAGLNGVIYSKDCSWKTAFDCRDVLSEGSKYQFIVHSIDKSKNRLKLSKRLPEQDPWKSKHLPDEGDIIEVDIVAISGCNYIGHYFDNIEVLVPIYEVSWLETDLPEETKLLYTLQQLVIYEKSEERRVLKGSIRRLEEDPWPQIHQRLPKGTELRATVLEVTSQFVRVALPDGLTGIIPKEAMMRGGFEYADFEKSVVKEQGLDVVISKVFIKKRKIRLDLKRNVSQRR